MKTKICLATLALAGAMLAMPAGAQAHFDRGFHQDWRCRMFGWLDHSRCKKVARHHHRHARKAEAAK